MGFDNNWHDSFLLHKHKQKVIRNKMMGWGWNSFQKHPPYSRSILQDGSRFLGKVLDGK